MKIGFRTIKTAVGAGLAVWIATLCDLEFSNSAAIITILCIENTKAKSIRASLHRFLACTLSLIFSSLLFEWLGYHTWVLSLFILCFIPFLLRYKLQSGFVTSIVIVLHVLTFKDINRVIFINEFLLILIGVGVAIALNSYMPNLESKITHQKEEIENLFSKILYEYALFLQKGDQGWNGKELLDAESLLKHAKLTAIQLNENTMMKNKRGYFVYFDMREKQFDILKRMLPIVSSLLDDVPQRHLFASFLMELSKNVKSQNTAHIYIKKLLEERENMKELPLPTTRREFETRASVFHLMNEIDYYLKTKVSFYQKYNQLVEDINK